nr:WecB/TagA/CpsF family glycosyltransferase [Methylorubrum aminovorans]
MGASLEFLVGRKRRAPLWMQRAGIEWLHRLAGEPRRLWRRYLFGVAPLARLALAEAAARLAARRALPRPTEH